MKLNVEKIKTELEVKERSIAWLARKAGMLPATLAYQLKTGDTTNDADKIAKAFGWELKDVCIDETCP